MASPGPSSTGGTRRRSAGVEQMNTMSYYINMLIAAYLEQLVRRNPASDLQTIFQKNKTAETQQ